MARIPVWEIWPLLRDVRFFHSSIYARTYPGELAFWRMETVMPSNNTEASKEIKPNNFGSTLEKVIVAAKFPEASVMAGFGAMDNSRNEPGNGVKVTGIPGMGAPDTDTVPLIA
ncbi:hypothetical protein ELR57_09485 [Cohnella sp. AR92]|nr:hypothetical protein ELR57_09485 [Cohnella sp. AR92]